MGWAGVLLAALFVVPGHSRSEGRSRFSLDAEGRVAVAITVGEPDLPELCNVDLALPDRAGEEQKLARCLARDIPLLVRLKADGRPCRLTYERFEARQGVVVIEARGQCPTLPATFVVDWGLFAGGGLDHVSVATIEQPFGEPRLFMLSRRSSRATLELDGPRWPWLGLGLAAGALAIVAVWRRARRRPSPPGGL